ncbi:MAG: hypothetical protein IAF58_05430 [Leptolyngbya sp.]|nr:hypothetical protein [Candidatus Melainabacteria bacterium]
MDKDLSSIEDVISGLYEAVSFNANEKPNHPLLRLLFHLQARITPPKEDIGGIVRSLDVEQFITHFAGRTKDIADIGGKELEQERRIVKFGRVAQVFSSYHFYALNSEIPIARGVNSIQLVNEYSRWWILSLTYDRAAAGAPLEIQTL